MSPPGSAPLPSRNAPHPTDSATRIRSSPISSSSFVLVLDFRMISRTKDEHENESRSSPPPQRETRRHRTSQHGVSPLPSRSRGNPGASCENRARGSFGTFLTFDRNGSRYSRVVTSYLEPRSISDLQNRLKSFCEKHPIRRLEVFGSVATGKGGPGSDVDLLVTLDESRAVSTAGILEMAGEAEELLGSPVDFVLKSALDRSPNRFARENILSTAICVYGS
jgi:predicted nucleotidyltransferase